MMEQDKTADIAYDPADCRTLGDGLSTDFLRDPKTLKADLRIATRIARAGDRWPMSEHKRRNIINRLEAVLNKKSVSAMSKFGPYDDEATADSNAISAARVLAMLEAQNQKDEQHIDTVAKPSAGTTVNIDNRKLTILRVPDNGRGPAIEQQ